MAVHVSTTGTQTRAPSDPLPLSDLTSIENDHSVLLSVDGALLRSPHAARRLAYIKASKPHGMLYVGVTAHLAARVDQHRRDVGPAFCRRYGIKTPVLAEPHDDIAAAIAREKALKAWPGVEDPADRGEQPGLARPLRDARLAAGDPSFRWGDGRG